MDTSKKLVIRFKIRRFDNNDNSGVDPEIILKDLELDPDSEYNDLKKEIQNICQVGPDDSKVIKLRREDEVLIPLSFLLEEPVYVDNYFYLDVCKINYAYKATTNLLQDAYIDSVCQKLRVMESRIQKAELLLPQLEWRRQSHMEETVNTLSTRVAFLNRRVDELIPSQWRSKMPQTIA